MDGLLTHTADPVARPQWVKRTYIKTTERITPAMNSEKRIVSRAHPVGQPVALVPLAAEAFPRDVDVGLGSNIADLFDDDPFVVGIFDHELDP